MSESLPPRAIADALHSLHETGCGCGKDSHPPSRGDMSRLKIALEAAQPAIRAAERERIRQLAIDRHALYLAGGVPDDGEPSGLMPFADLIGQP